MEFERIVVLTGAGISAESGLGTFRDASGLWAAHDLRAVATPEGFTADPARVHAFYNARRADAARAAPNPAHYALSRLARHHAGELHIITQNIDDLHERAGSPSVLHMHGEIVRALCAACGHRWPAPVAMHAEDGCPACAATTTRPDVVWFGEYPHGMDDIWYLLRRADLFVSIGTSGSVYPAAAFVTDAARAGARTLELNLEPSLALTEFDESRHGAASVVVPEWVEEMITLQKVSAAS